MDNQKKRTLEIELSDEECSSISNLSAQCGLTVGQLLESFIGDLINSESTNGSDEREIAQNWIDRCGFRYYPDISLLKYIVNQGFYVDDFLIALDEQQYFNDHPEEYTDQNAWFKSEIDEIIIPYLKKYPSVNLDDEIAHCRKWNNEFL